MNGIGRALRGSAALLALTAAAVAIGCGGSDGGGASASAPDDAREQFQEARLDFSRCMRENGVDMPDPQAGTGNGVVMKVGPGDGMDPESSQFRDAEEECREHLEGIEPPEIDPEQQQELQETALAFARCMRGEGIDMPDPQVDGGRMRMQIRPGSGLDRDDPALEAAHEKCQDKLPRPPGGPGAPPR